MKKLITVIFYFLLFSPAHAAEDHSDSSVKQLLANGYKAMTSAETSQQLINKTLLIIDLQSAAEYQITLTESGTTQLKKITEENPGTLTDSDYQSRAAVLTGKMSLKILNDNIISTDGIRSYTITLYQKGKNIFGVRDIDSGKALFQIKIQ